MAQTTKSPTGGKSKPQKPKKPYKDFPLFPHATGRWAKKIRGRMCYFGKWDDPDAALQKYLDERDALHAGRTPRVSIDTLTIRELVNSFLTAKERQVVCGELEQRSFDDYHRTCARIVKAFGKSTSVDDLEARDFATLRSSMAQSWGPVTLKNEITRVRAVFNYAYKADLIDRPVRFGNAFDKPPKRLLRKARQERGKRMLEPEEIHKMIRKAPVQMKAMIWLGINCGFGNGDVGNLPIRAVDLKRGWVDFPRPKTHIERRCPLWPETIEAIQRALTVRPKPADEAYRDRVFLTHRGAPWSNGTPSSPVSRACTKLLRDLGIHRPGLSFYALRHTFQTVADGSKDKVAVDHIMGHVDPSMAAEYREEIDDQRLRDVTDHVRKWLGEIESSN